METTLRDACGALGIRQPATLRKWMARLGVAPKRHELDWRFRTISDAELRRIREARAARPHVAPDHARVQRARAAMQAAPVLPADGYYANVGQRARFLLRHGWPIGTTRGWRDCPLGPTEEDVLRYALEHDAAAGYRATTHKRVVHECAVRECPCHALMRGRERRE